MGKNNGEVQALRVEMPEGGKLAPQNAPNLQRMLVPGARCASSREPTPGPGHYNPEHPAVCGRIPGRVPGHPKLRRDPDIRL